MKLFLVTAHYPYSRGEEFLEDELRVLQNRFSEIVILCREKHLDTPCRYLPENARVVPVRRHFALHAAKGLFSLFSPRVQKELFSAADFPLKEKLTALWQSLTHESMLSAALAKERWEADNAVFYSYWLEPLFLGFKKSHPEARCVCRAHGGDCFYHRGYHPFRKETLALLDGVFPISEAGRADLLAHTPSADPEKITVARLGIPAEPLACPPPEDGVLHGVSCSNLIPLKRLDLLIDALALYDLPFTWVHFGTGPLEESLKKRAAEKLGDRFVFAGYTPKRDILDYYRTHPLSVFVNCSDAEGIPVSVMEAQSRSLPCIARNVGGMAEIVDDSCGILLPEAVTPKDLCEALHRITPEMRQGAGEMFSRRYRAETNYSHFAKLLMGD